MRRVVVVGGGDGGLTAAIALRQVGCEVLVIERSKQFGEVGAGLQLGPHATRVLRRHRPDLVRILAAQLPESAVRLGTEVTEVHTPPDGPPSVRLADGEEVTADLVVDVVRNWLGPGQHLVSYPVGPGARYINLVCIVSDPDWSEESWTAPGRVEDLRAHFEGWSPRLRELLDAISGPVFRWALYDRKSMPNWSTARTTLLGDAAHPMLPFLAQGAAQAIEDTAALAARLRETPDGSPEAAIVAYEQAPRPHTARIQLMSWDNNSSFHLPDGPDQRRRDEAFARDDRMRLDRLGWMYGNDAEQLVA